MRTTILLGSLLLAAGHLPAQMDSPITIADNSIPIELNGSKQAAQAAKGKAKRVLSPARFNYVVVSHDKQFTDTGSGFQFRDVGYSAVCITGASASPINVASLQSWSVDFTNGQSDIQINSASARGHVDIDYGAYFHTPPLGPPWRSFFPNLTLFSATVTTTVAGVPSTTPSFQSTGVMVHYCTGSTCKTGSTPATNPCQE